MQYLRDLQDEDINQLLDLGESLKTQLKDFEQQQIINKTIFVEVIKAIMQAYQQQTRLELPIELRSFAVAEVFYDLETLIRTYISTEQAAIVTIPMRADMVLNGSKDYDYMVNDLIEINALVVAKRKNISLDTTEEEEQEQKDEEVQKSKYTLDQINEVLHQSNEYASIGSCGNALEAIEELEIMIEDFDKYNHLIIDRPLIQNNKAFALFCLNRLDEALECIDDVLYDNEDFALAHHTRAEILDALGYYREAVASMDRAIALDNTPDKVEFREMIWRKLRRGRW